MIVPKLQRPTSLRPETSNMEMSSLRQRHHRRPRIRVIEQHGGLLVPGLYSFATPKVEESRDLQLRLIMAVGSWEVQELRVATAQWWRAAAGQRLD